MSKILTSFAVVLFLAVVFIVASTTVSAFSLMKKRTKVNDNSTTIRVGAVQIFPVVPSSGATPQQTIAATADLVVNTIITGSISPNSNSTVPSTDFLNFPEFLFQGGLEYAKSGSCSGDGTNSSGELRNYCFPVPAAGEPIDCSALNAPASAVACNLMKKAASVAAYTAFSINVCELMPNNGTLFNTQVVIKNGVVLAKYRKFHPFFTSCFTKPDLELVTFDLKGRTFGIFTCFDILWKDPKMDLVKMGIKYFSYSVAIPMIGRLAVEVFSGENKVNVVTSNAAAGQSGVVVDGKAVATTSGSSTDIAFYDLN